MTDQPISTATLEEQATHADAGYGSLRARLSLPEANPLSIVRIVAESMVIAG